MTRLNMLVELAERIPTGGRPALEALLRASLPFAHAVARARLGDGVAANDAAADALVRVARGIHRLHDPRAYPAWLRRIAIRCAADVRRTRSGAADVAHVDRSDPAPAPVDALARGERSHQVREAIAALGPSLREVVVLHFLEELSYREIAAVLGVGIGTVARRMEKARSSLREELEEKR